MSKVEARQSTPGGWEPEPFQVAVFAEDPGGSLKVLVIAPVLDVGGQEGVPGWVDRLGRLLDEFEALVQGGVFPAETELVEDDPHPPDVVVGAPQPRVRTRPECGGSSSQSKDG